MADSMQQIVSLAKRRGIIFPSSEIYGGVEALWDFGPLGSLMKDNLKKFWKQRFVQKKENISLLDASLIMSPEVWKASGHIENFTDPLIECKECHSRFRADHMADGRFADQGKAKKKGQCPECGAVEFTAPKNFNLMFKTFLGPLEDEAHVTYLRPETAQAMFVDFKLIQETQRFKIPFGIAQVGKAFRNEITTGNFIFRCREFEIAEIEYFVKPGADEKEFEVWLQEWKQFFIDLGIREDHMRLYEHPKESLAHYSKRTVDIEYKFPFGWGEIAGVANRTDFDLKQHSKFSGKNLVYKNEDTGESYLPYVIEPTMGVDRVLLALLCEGYEEVKGARTKTTEASKEVEVVLKLPRNISPIQVAVLPLVKNRPEIVSKAREIYLALQNYFMCKYDESGSIGRRYRRQDEIGTPYCITVDFETLEKNDVTLRDRDTMSQERIPVDSLKEFLKEKYA